MIAYVKNLYLSDEKVQLPALPLTFLTHSTARYGRFMAIPCYTLCALWGKECDFKQTKQILTSRMYPLLTFLPDSCMERTVVFVAYVWAAYLACNSLHLTVSILAQHGHIKNNK